MDDFPGYVTVNGCAMMKVTRINKVKKYRIFRDFSWPSHLLDFNEKNLIYGWNATGKTTLSNVFRALEKHIPINEGEIEVQIDRSKVRADSISTASNLPQIRVFNRDFIAENVFTKDDTVSPIFFLGEESIEKQKEADRLNKEKKEKSDALAKKFTEKNSKATELDKFCQDRANNIVKPLLRSAGKDNPYNNYNKTDYQQQCEVILGLADDERTSKALSNAQRATYEKQLKATKRDSLSEVTLTLPNLGGLKDKVNRLISQTVVSKTIEALKNNAELALWVKQGLAMHKKDDSLFCLFCGSQIPECRLEDLENHFNDQYEILITEIDSLRESILANQTQLEGFKALDKANLYEDLAPTYQTHLEALKRHIATIIGYLKTLNKLLERKKGKLFEVLVNKSQSVDSNAPLVEKVNIVIRKHNLDTRGFEDFVANARVILEGTIIAESLGDYEEKKKALSKAENEFDALEKEIQALKKQIEDIEKVIVEHHKAAYDLNDDLQAYLGTKEIEFQVKDTGYQIIRNGSVARNLSESERTAIAFLYFLKTLNDKSFRLKDGIVVIDDPVSSLDSNALFHAFGYMKERTKDAGQLFILTHNNSMFRQIKNWFNHLPGQRKQDMEARPARFYMLTCSLDDEQRSAKLVTLDRLLHEYESEYHYLFKLVYEAANTAPGDPLESFYHMPNVARRLLETFLAFRYPKQTGELKKTLDLIDFDVVKRTRILRFLHTHSHSGVIDDTEHDSSILTETKQVLTDMLDLIRSEDMKHFDKMKELIS